jgi:hypothetical protein
VLIVVCVVLVRGCGYSVAASCVVSVLACNGKGKRWGGGEGVVGAAIYLNNYFKDCVIVVCIEVIHLYRSLLIRNTLYVYLSISEPPFFGPCYDFRIIYVAICMPCV